MEAVGLVVVQPNCVRHGDQGEGVVRGPARWRLPATIVLVKSWLMSRLSGSSLERLRYLRSKCLAYNQSTLLLYGDGIEKAE